jgi:hypothetical protein
MDEINEYIDEEVYYSDDDSYESDEYVASDDEFDYIRDEPFLPVDILPSPVRWVVVSVDGVKLEVSNMGRIRQHNTLCNIYESTEGIILHGTPYRIYQIQIEPGVYKNYYVHELVWQGFNGIPPNGWVIRHKCEYTQKARRTYSNKLANITIVQNKISPLYIEKGTPYNNYISMSKSLYSKSS